LFTFVSFQISVWSILISASQAQLIGDLDAEELKEKADKAAKSKNFFKPTKFYLKVKSFLTLLPFLQIFEIKSRLNN
jgi:hypothetical protein